MGKINFTGDIESYYLGHQLGEMFKERVYDPYLIGRENLVIADIGANIGMFSLYAHKYAKQIIAIEPDPGHFKDLQDNIKDNKLDRVTPLNVAVSDKEGQLDFYQNDNQTMNSLMPQISSPSHPPIKVQASPLSKIFKDIEKIDFVKLDVEGKEQDIIQSEDFIKVAPKIQEMVMEVHSWTGRHPNQMRDALKQNGFIVEVIPHQTTLWHVYRQ